MRLHRKVWLWWGKGWAVQLYRAAYLSVGIHVDLRRPLLLDVHFGWLIIALGVKAVETLPIDRHRHTCRGFLFADSPVL